MTLRCRRSGARSLLLALALAVAAGRASGQTITQRGFVEAGGWLFPETASNDRVHAVADLLAREEVFATPAGWLRVSGGIDFRTNSHEQADERWRLDWGDRTARRPRLSVRRLAATIGRGPVVAEVGKQFIRWGRADVVNPTDRFAPRDFMNVVDNEFLAVTAARLTVTAGADSIEAVWVPRFTPSRTPLIDQRWTAIPEDALGIVLVDAGAVLPAGRQVGGRWNHVGGAADWALSFFDGFNHLPNIAVAPLTISRGSAAVSVIREYPAVRSYGADAAVPTRWVTVKGEAAYFTSPSPTTDEYVLWVVQLERQTGEWMFVGGYAGEAVTERRSILTFAPDRGVARSVLGRASYTIDSNRSVALEGAVRQNADGAYVKAEYSQARGQHWRATITGALIGGEPDDFLGQYRRNSHVILTLRYSF